MLIVYLSITLGRPFFKKKLANISRITEIFNLFRYDYERLKHTQRNIYVILLWKVFEAGGIFPDKMEVHCCT